MVRWPGQYFDHTGIRRDLTGDRKLAAYELPRCRSRLNPRFGNPTLHLVGLGLRGEAD